MSSQKKKSTTPNNKPAAPSEKPASADPAPAAGKGSSKDEIAKAAFLISKENKSYNDWVYIAAEADLMSKNPRATADEVKKAAADLFAKHPKIQDLHWIIAEKRTQKK